MYVDLAGFYSRLTKNITAKTRSLHIDDEDELILLEHLKDGDHTFFEIRDGNAIEIVKLTNICDKLVLERGVEKTNPLAFRCGVGISFTLTMQGVKDTVCQMGDCE